MSITLLAAEYEAPVPFESIPGRYIDTWTRFKQERRHLNIRLQYVVKGRSDFLYEEPIYSFWYRFGKPSEFGYGVVAFERLDTVLHYHAMERQAKTLKTCIENDDFGC